MLMLMKFFKPKIWKRARAISSELKLVLLIVEQYSM